MKKIRIAQIGMNRYSHAPEIFDTLKKRSDLFDIAGYALVEDERQTCSEKLRHFDGYPELSLDEILNDSSIEAVTVETDEIHLTRYAQLAAQHGKHIHMEKPGSQNLAEFERLIELVRQSGKVFHIGYMYRYNPFVADAIRRAKAGEFGTIYSVEAHMSRLDSKTTRQWFGSFRGGMMFYLGCHLIDLVLQIQGMPEEVIPLNTATGIDGVNTEDLGFAVLRYPHAISVVRMGGTEIGGNKRRQLVIGGSRRTLEICPLEVGVHDIAEPYVNYVKQCERYLDEEGKLQIRNDQSNPFQRYEDMLASFAAMVRGEKENPYTLEYELSLFRTLLQACGIREEFKDFAPLKQ